MILRELYFSHVVEKIVGIEGDGCKFADFFRNLDICRKVRRYPVRIEKIICWRFEYHFGQFGV